MLKSNMYTIPQSLWSAVVLYQLMMDRDSDNNGVDHAQAEIIDQMACSEGCFMALLVCCISGFPWIVSLLVSSAMQVAFIYFIYETQAQLPSNPTAEACPTHLTLRVSGALLLTTYCFAELKETYSMFMWTMKMKTTDATENLQIEYENDDETPKQIVSGFTKCYKANITFWIVLPKLAIGVALWWLGILFVMKSESNSDLVLNAVAVLFVLEIDDQLFTALVPSSFAKVFGDLPPVGKMTDEDDLNDFTCSCVSGFCGQWFNFAMIALMTWGSIHSACK